MSENKKTNKLMDSLMKIPFFKKLKTIKHIEIIIVVIFISLLLLIYFYGFKTEKTSSASNMQSDNLTYINSSEYAKELENKILKVVTSLKGVKNATVFVSLESGSELVIAKTTEEKTIQTGSGTNVTITTSPVLVSNGGKESPIILAENLPKVQGIIVVASGTEDVNIKLNIYRILETIFSIPSDRIQVFAGK